MKNSNNITKIAFATIALAFVAAMSFVVPEGQFQPYKLEMDSLWKKTANEHEYLIDISGNQTMATVRHHNINIPGHSIELQQGNKIHQTHIFEYGDKFIGKYLKFADIDGNSTLELLFVSAQKYVAYLNIYSYNTDTKKLLQTERIRIDSIGKWSDQMDNTNNFIVTNGSDIYFDLQGSYSIQPRNVYKYDFKNKKLIKNRLNSLVTLNAIHFNFQKQDYLLATHTKASGNTISPREAEMLRTSTDKDTLEMYETFKHLEYEYGDFSSYVLLYDDSLRFAFEPIEFFGWTNYTKAAIVLIEGTPHIVAFTNAQMDEPENEESKLVTLCNLKGEILKQYPLPHAYTEVFSENGKVVFWGDKTLYIANEKLELQSEIEGITHALGFVDINQDNTPEFVAYRNNVLTIFSENFDINATFKIEQEFAPYPEKFNFYNLKADNKNSLIFNTRLFYYKFDYIKNNISIFKYPFYIAVFLLIFGILYLVFRLNSKRLEKENLKLEKIVTERTKEIASQKDEIQAQAEELQTQNEHLEELSKFKKLMTGTIIHDLKNPLNYIIGSSKDKSIRQSGYNMLNIVLNILDINKAQTTNLNVKIEKQNIDDLIKNAVEQVEFLAEQKNIEIEKNISKKFDINADKELTTRTIVNLLTNAIKFSPMNKKIAIRVYEKEKNVQIDVTDYGIGISKESVKTIFQEYSQIEAKKSGKVKSTGLGLTFCKIATEAQNAQIKVSSVPGEKTTFSLVFPLAAVAEKKPRHTETQKNDFLLTPEERKKIQPVLLKIKKIETFQATDILNLLKTIEDSSQNIKRWKQKVKAAMFASNDELFKKLVNNEL